MPPYSPDLNSVELAFRKHKSLVRSAGERTVEGLWQLAGRLLDAIPARRMPALSPPLRHTTPA